MGTPEMPLMMYGHENIRPKNEMGDRKDRRKERGKEAKERDGTEEGEREREGRRAVLVE
jgi:hypothetical protein